MDRKLLVALLLLETVAVVVYAVRHERLRKEVIDLRMQLARSVARGEMVTPGGETGQPRRVPFRMKHEAVIALFLAQTIVLSGDPSQALTPQQSSGAMRILESNLQTCEGIAAEDTRVADGLGALSSLFTAAQRGYVEQHREAVGEKIRAVARSGRRSNGLCHAALDYLRDPSALRE